MEAEGLQDQGLAQGEHDDRTVADLLIDQVLAKPQVVRCTLSVLGAAARPRCRLITFTCSTSLRVTDHTHHSAC